MRLLTLFNTKNLCMSKKNITFATDLDEEPTALATFPKNGIPVLNGEVAERFVRMAEENERKAKEMRSKPLTKEEAEKEVGFKRIILEYKKNEIKQLEKEIKKLEEIINLTD